MKTSVNAPNREPQTYTVDDMKVGTIFRFVGSPYHDDIGVRLNDSYMRWDGRIWTVYTRAHFLDRRLPEDLKGIPCPAGTTVTFTQE